MFSSLEALDAPEPMAVTRQGVFQPKAKPRLRKAGGGSVLPASTAAQKPCEVLCPSLQKVEDVTSYPSALQAVTSPGVVSPTGNGNEEVHKVANTALEVPACQLPMHSALLSSGNRHGSQLESSLRSTGKDLKQVEIHNVLGGSAIMAELQPPLLVEGQGDIEIGLTEGNATAGKDFSSAEIFRADLNEDAIVTKSQFVLAESNQGVDLGDDALSFIKAPCNDQVDGDTSLHDSTIIPGSEPEVAGHVLTTKGAVPRQASKRKKARFAAEVVEITAEGRIQHVENETASLSLLTSIDEVPLNVPDIRRAVDKVAVRKRKRHATLLVCNEQGSTVDPGVSDAEASTQVAVDKARIAETVQLYHGSVGATEEKRKRYHRSRVQQEVATHGSNEIVSGSLLASTNGGPKRLATFAAVESDVPEADPGLACNTEPSTITEISKKKRLKHGSQRKQRVVRRFLNPIDPDLDPSKMTMKDIIRLAEAKERTNNEGTSKKSREESERRHLLNAQAEEQAQHKREGISFAPQVQVVDGRIVINEESLTISARQVDDVQNFTRVEETHSKLNYHSYMKRTPKERWKATETELFYKAVRQFGTDFALIQHLFPGRSRRQVFLKFKKEERTQPRRLADAMTHRSRDHSQYKEIITCLNLSTDTTEGQCHSTSKGESNLVQNQLAGEIMGPISDASTPAPSNPEVNEGFGERPKCTKEDRFKKVAGSKDGPLLPADRPEDGEFDQLNSKAWPCTDSDGLSPSKASKSLKTESSPPQARSLLSYKGSSLKAPRSLFSYGHL